MIRYDPRHELVGGTAGAWSGANGALGADLYNRQDHPEEKKKAQQIADDAKARGITNPDGSPITVDQIENAMRSANNSDYGETITTGMVVPLNGSTNSSQLYDTTGMLVTNDGAGNNYLVQDPSMLTSPSDTVRNLILQDTGGANSPYSWNVPSPQAQTSGGAPKVDLNGPFSPGWNTGDYSAGLGTTYRGLAPDYATVEGSFLSLSGAGAVNLYDGTKYLSAGPTQNFPTSSWKPGLVGTVGWIWGAHDANATNAFLNGDGNQAFVSVPTEFGFNVVGALTHAHGGSTALELGITPKGDFSAGVTPWSHGVPVLDKKQ